MSTEAMKLALDFFEKTSNCLPIRYDKEGLAVHTALRLAIEQAQSQEPVGFVVDLYNGANTPSLPPTATVAWLNDNPKIGQVLYATSPPRCQPDKESDAVDALTEDGWVWDGDQWQRPHQQKQEPVVLKFPRHEKQLEDDWTIDPAFITRVEQSIDPEMTWDFIPTMEQVQVTLLALEVIPTSLFISAQRQPLTDEQFLELLLRTGTIELVNLTTFIGDSIQMRGKISLRRSSKLIKEFVEAAHNIKD